MNNDKKLKIKLYRLKSYLFQKRAYNNKIISNDILKYMRSCIEKLKEVDSIYTLADIEEYKYNTTKYPDTKFYFLIGSDQLEVLHKWYNIDELAKICQLVLIKIPNYVSSFVSLT